MPVEVRPGTLTGPLLRYCPDCGAPLGVVAPVVCRACGAEHWRNAKPCAGGLVVRGGLLLLVRRSISPWHGCWDIPGGFCEPDEHPAATVVREVREETGLEVRVTALLGIWMDTYGTAVGAVPADATMNCYFTAVPLDDRAAVVDPAESSEAGWFTPDAIPRELAFPDHAGLVIQAWRDAASSDAPGPDGTGS